MAIKDKYFTITEAAKYLHVTRQTIGLWIKEGKLPAESVGRETIIEKSQIEKYKLNEFFEFVKFEAIEQLQRAIMESYGFGVVAEITLQETQKDGIFIFGVTKKDGRNDVVEIQINRVSVDLDIVGNNHEIRFVIGKVNKLSEEM